METAADGTSIIHRLHDNVLLVLLDRKTDSEEAEPEGEEAELSLMLSDHDESDEQNTTQVFNIESTSKNLIFFCLYEV